VFDLEVVNGAEDVVESRERVLLEEGAGEVGATRGLDDV
jgi:hypothetical protein